LSKKWWKFCTAHDSIHMHKTHYLLCCSVHWVV
jgi:hypothetical protein